MLKNLKFWKKESDPLAELDELNKEETPEPSQSTSIASSAIPEFGSDLKEEPVGDVGKDASLELINSKLDTIKSELDSINQRLKTVERIAVQEESKTTQNKKIW